MFGGFVEVNHHIKLFSFLDLNSITLIEKRRRTLKRELPLLLSSFLALPQPPLPLLSFPGVRAYVRARGLERWCYVADGGGDGGGRKERSGEGGRGKGKGGGNRGIEGGMKREDGKGKDRGLGKGMGRERG